MSALSLFTSLQRQIPRSGPVQQTGIVSVEHSGLLRLQPTCNRRPDARCHYDFPPHVPPQFMLKSVSCSGATSNFRIWKDALYQ